MRALIDRLGGTKRVLGFGIAAIILIAICCGYWVRIAQQEAAARAAEEKRQKDIAAIQWLAREEARQKREKAEKDRQTAEASAQKKSRKDAMNADPVVAWYIREHPEMAWPIRSYGSTLATELQFAVHGGRLSAADAQHIVQFSRDLQKIPE